MSDLNAAQLEAVTHKTGPLLIIAGAGTGKTTVITRRIAHLITEKIVKPEEILALTFTDKAAEEMEMRVDLLVPYGFVEVFISTFHAFCDRVLRDYAIDLGLRPDFKVMSTAEQVIFFREHLFDFPLKHYLPLGDPTKHVLALINVISRAKDEDISPEEYVEFAKKQASGTKAQGTKASGTKAKEITVEAEKCLEIAQVYKKYQELKLENGMIDFGDQVCLVLELFRKHPAILKKFRDKYKYILIDEFQDTNFAQFELLKLLANKKSNLTAVADDDQAIYRFRGAAINNVLGFEKYYKNTKKVVLTENYRSSQIILDTSYKLIKHNDPERLEVQANINKKLVAGKDIKGLVEHKHFDSVYSEADWVAKTIKEKFEAKQNTFKDFAILVRSNSDAEPFRQSLNVMGIPHQFSGGGGLYVYPEIRLVLSFMRVIGDLSDSISLYDLSLSELYRVDPLDLQKITTFANRRNYTLHYAYHHLPEANGTVGEFSHLRDLKEETFAAVAKIMEDIHYYLDYSRDKTTGEVLYEFLKRSGFLSKLTKEINTENEDRIRNLAKFFDKIREFQGVATVDRIAEFVKYLNILKEAGDDPESAQPDFDVDAVNILTIHKAKGLEFPVVFMVSLVSDKFPTRSRKSPIELPDNIIKESLPGGEFHLREERRLFYVGMTRAKNELYLTSAQNYGGKRDRKVSQFVLEALDKPKADLSLFKKPVIEQIELFAPRKPSLPRDNKIPDGVQINLSSYQVDDYLTCPLKYKYVHVLRVPLLPNHAIIFGSALHKAVQSYFTAKKNQQAFSLDDLIQGFKDNWSSEGFISRQHEERRLAQGIEALTRFFERDKKSTRVPTMIEEKFAVMDGNISIRGRLDLVEEENGKTFIVDFKSSEVKEQEAADKKADDSIQLSIYALSWFDKYKKLPDALELNFINSGLVGRSEKTLEDLKEVRQTINEVASGIRDANFVAKPNYIFCKYCAYSELCPSSAV